MLDMLKSGVRYSLGAGAMAKETMEKAWDDLLKEREEDVEEGKQMVEDLLKQFEEGNEKAKKTIEEEIQKIIQSFPLATKGDFESLREELRSVSEKDEEQGSKKRIKRKAD